MATFINRWNAIAERKRLKILGYVSILLFNIFFSASMIFDLAVYLIDSKKFILFQKDISSMTSYSAQILTVGLVFGVGVVLIDMRMFLHRVSIHFVGYEGWMLGLGVDVFFEWLDKLDGVKTDDSVKVLSVLGYAAIGYIVTTIGINYIKDRTGLTVASFIAGVKVTMKYKYEKEYRDPSLYQWIMILALIFSCFLCKLTEGTGNEPEIELQPAVLPAVIPPQTQPQNNPGRSPRSGKASPSNSARHRKGAGNA